jgi:hypothetical protein
MGNVTSGTEAPTHPTIGPQMLDPLDSTHSGTGSTRVGDARPASARGAPVDLDREPSTGALLERVMRLRAACYGLSQDLAASRCRMRALEAEVRELKQAQAAGKRQGASGLRS